jgi:hypothetical protein
MANGCLVVCSSDETRQPRNWPALLGKHVIYLVTINFDIASLDFRIPSVLPNCHPQG